MITGAPPADPYALLVICISCLFSLSLLFSSDLASGKMGVRSCVRGSLVGGSVGRSVGVSGESGAFAGAYLLFFFELATAPGCVCVRASAC